VSKVSAAALVQILMADFAAVDQAGKLNIIGGTIAVVGRSPDAASTFPFSVIAMISVPATLYGETSMLELLLEDADGNPVDVQLPGQVAPQHVKITNSAQFIRPKTQSHIDVPVEYLRGRTTLVVQFPTGLPLAGGRGYQWRVVVDGATQDSWTELFTVTDQLPASELAQS
jgi:hypothetical protein